jgi:SAM-dependent methyltransferase
MSIIKNKKEWETFSEQEMEEYKNNIFLHYRKEGFPFFKLTEKELEKEINKLKVFNTDSILLEDDKLKQVMTGLNFVNYFMNHMWETKCHSFETPMKAFLDDSTLKKAIDKRIRFGDNISDAGMRKVLSWVTGTHRVSNFRPTVAKWIYDNFSNEGNVLDFSCGYGGRLFGALSSKKVKSYTGTDPCTKTYNKLLEIVKTIKSDKKVILYNKPFEDLELEKEFYDLSFSSPPYFNTEEYSYEPSQSFIRYNSKEEWKNNFLKPLIENNFRYLKKDGNFLINIANVKTYPELEQDTIDLCIEAGFTYIKTYKMSLSSLMNTGFKYEPIFHFKK